MTTIAPTTPLEAVTSIGVAGKEAYTAITAPSTQTGLGRFGQEAHNLIAPAGLALAGVTFITNYLHTKFGIGNGTVDSSLVGVGAAIAAASKLIDSANNALTNFKK